MPSVTPIFQKHLDVMKKLHEELKESISKGFASIELDDVLRNPEAELHLFANDLSQALLKKYSNLFIAEGIRFADEMKGPKKLQSEE